MTNCPRGAFLFALAMTLLSRSMPAARGSDARADLFSRDNLIAWCIVPYDGAQRTPEQRAEMLERLGIRHFAYDWRAKHLPTFEQEIDALERHHIELTAVWFPDSLNADALTILDVLRKHNLHPQLWVSSYPKPKGDERETVNAEASVLRPVAEEAAKLGCTLALYNHGGWFGEPEHQIEIIKHLQSDGLTNVGIVYNLHHTHDQIDRLPAILREIKPYLVAITLNGMTANGEKIGRGILPIGYGELDLHILRTIRDSGYSGRLAILNHTDQDAEARLQDNMDGLAWLAGQLDGKPATPEPKLRTDPTAQPSDGAPANAAHPPAPYGPLPSPRQLAWHDMEFYGFLHFTVNTFTDKEWGYGDESEKVFNPTDFNADQIVQTAKEAGMKGLVLTCKHHDGFCLWPSKYTEHSVKNSPWKNGRGDVVREISDACHRHGLKFGVYLSPWDRNRSDYGTPAYITYYRNQLRELLSNYGDIFIVWFDGANGGDGYYGGARTMRRIDNSTFYDWPNTWSIVRQLMPGAVMFSDAGPDVRWVGNERGTAGSTCWETMDMTEPRRFPGGSSKGLNSGERPGTAWLPPECDVSIRPGWFYHASEDRKVKTPQQLLDIYYESVGRGACLNINIPPDRRGQIHDDDLRSLHEFRRILDETFKTDFARGARLVASNVRGNSRQFAAGNLIDGNRDTYWSTDDNLRTPQVVLDLGKPVTFNVVGLREFLPLGQRVDEFAIDQWKGGAWKEFAHGTSIGNRRLIRGAKVTTDKVRLRITGAPVCPALSEFALYAEPDR